MLEDLVSEERLKLLRFVCSFAWADLQVRPEERAFVASLVARLELEAGERRRVQGWLEKPPEPDEVDPAGIPRAHRVLFLESIQGVIAADGEIAPEERESLEILQALLAP